MVLEAAALFGFRAEYLGDHPAYDAFDEYLRTEFVKRHPGWEARFGKGTWFDPATDRYNYMFLLTGSVPDAKSQKGAERKVQELLDELAQGLASLPPKAEKKLPSPIARVWRWHS
jgi:hypothetical protein